MALIEDRETSPVGRTEQDQQRNAVLLSDYDYSKYDGPGITGYTGQDLQRIALVRWKEAVRTRVGPRGNYKAGLARLSDGRLVLATCRDNFETDPSRRRFYVHVYESVDTGLSWQEISETSICGKEPSLTVLPGDRIVMTVQGAYFGPDRDANSNPFARSEDGGRTWQTAQVPGADYPRNLIVERDGTLLMIRAMASDWTGGNGGSPNLQVARSKDGLSWEYGEGVVDWDWCGFGEVASIRLSNGKLLAALRRQIPGTLGEGFEDTVLTESTDDGKHWTRPWPMSNTAEVHVYLTELMDGRILSTYSNYHLPWGAFAVLSEDGGKTWDLDQPIQLALSADMYVGWPVTLQLPDESLITSYAATTYCQQPPARTTCEVVRWSVPAT